MDDPVRVVPGAQLLEPGEAVGREVRRRAAHEPHRIGFYLYDLAAEFHGLWNRGKDSPQLRFIYETDRELTRARLALVAATRAVLASGLGILGVQAMHEMH
mgnify:CR=1 FL=1